MHTLKKYLGLVWMALGPVTLVALIITAFRNITAGGSADINQPIPWIIIISIFTPIAIGLTIFGWYAWKEEYRD